MSRLPSPIFEPQPKTEGFRILVPNPLSLHNFAYQAADTAGDKPSLHKSFADCFNYLSQTTHEWTTGQWRDKNKILDGVGVELSGNYSLDSGMWASITAAIDFTEYSEQFGYDYLPAGNYHKIIKFLGLHGVRGNVNEPYYGPTGGVSIIFDDMQTNFDLGYLNREATQRNMSEDTQNFMMLTNYGLDLDYKDKFSKQIRHFATITSWCVESIYNLLGYKSPDFVLEVSL